LSVNGNNVWHSGNLNLQKLVQVGGVDQGNSIYLAWTSSNLQLTVDTTTIGNVWTSANFNPNSKANAWKICYSYRI
jgi:hypothetical protein